MAKRRRSQPVRMKREESLSLMIKAPKSRDISMQALIARKGAGAGSHQNKATRGDGRGKGKSARHPKHKGDRGW